MCISIAERPDLPSDQPMQSGRDHHGHEQQGRDQRAGWQAESQGEHEAPGKLEFELGGRDSQQQRHRPSESRNEDRDQCRDMAADHDDAREVQHIETGCSIASEAGHVAADERHPSPSGRECEECSRQLAVTNL